MLGLGRVGAYLYLKFFTCSLLSRTVNSGQGKTLGVTIKAQCVLSNGWKLLLLSFFFFSNALSLLGSETKSLIQRGVRKTLIRSQI